MIKTLCLDIDDLDLSKQNIKGRKIKLIVKEEEVYILNMVLPKMNGSALRMVIRDELGIRFKNTDNIMFDYCIMSKSKNSTNVKVFCFNWKETQIVSSIMEAGGIIKAVLPVQFSVLEKHMGKINEKNYYFVFIYSERLYLMEVVDHVVAMNRILKDFFLEEKFKCSSDVRHVYHLNIEEHVLKNCFENGFQLISLGDKL